MGKVTIIVESEVVSTKLLYQAALAITSGEDDFRDYFLDNSIEIPETDNDKNDAIRVYIVPGDEE
mgnify:CR=1 FL=1